MNLLMRASQVNGLPVVTIRGGDDVAEVRDVVYDPSAGTVVGLTLNKRGFSRDGCGRCCRPRPSTPSDATQS